MAQSVYNIPDSSGVDFLTNINAVLGAIQTINSGATPPTDTQSGMWWGDISNSSTFYLKMRNHTNDGWVSLYAYDVATSTIRALSNDKYLAEITGATGAVFLPNGTTAQRPTLTSGERALRYNTDNAELEFWDGTAWDSVGGDLDINSLTDKITPDNTDNMVLQESGGLLKKLSWGNLKENINSKLYVSVYRTGTSQSISANVITKIQFNATEFDSTNSFDTTLHRFQPNIAGYYNIFCRVKISGTFSAGQGARVEAYKNGVAYKTSASLRSPAVTGNITPTNNLIVYLDGIDDYIEVFANSEVNSTIGQDENYITRFEAFLIGD